MNQYINFYIDNVINTFRLYNDSLFNVSIQGLGQFAKKEDAILDDLLSRLAECGFTVNMDSDTAEECFCILTIYGENKKTGEEYNFCYNVQDLLCLIDLSSKTNVSVVCIMVMKIIAMLIYRIKILYKAIVLDLDDTLWNGTLSEIGIEKIIAYQKVTTGIQFIRFANFIKVLSDNMGIYVAVCSRNDSKKVSEAIDKLGEDIFPLKSSIDCIIANNNDKSSNIREIATQLSILPKSIVFIDDNEIIRDEVRNNISGICVPSWKTHEELITLLSIGCIFDRYELSLNAQNRRAQYHVIQVARTENRLPLLHVKELRDTNHIEAIKLYNKSNQFNMSQQNGNFDSGVNSVYFKISWSNGKDIGICSALSYTIDNDLIVVENWAISCRFFEIGLEELILICLIDKANGKRIMFKFNKNDDNGKATAMVTNNAEFRCVDGNTQIEYAYTPSTKEELRLKTNLIMIND